MKIFGNALDIIVSLLSRIPTPFPTYIVPVITFRELFKGIDESKLRNATVKIEIQHIPIRVKYLINPIKIIECYNNDGKKIEMYNGPSIETRITMNNGRRIIFMFDTLYMPSPYEISGNCSRIFPSYKRTINIDSVIKIEVQDGMKHYRYVY